MTLPVYVWTFGSKRYGSVSSCVVYECAFMMCWPFNKPPVETGLSEKKNRARVTVSATFAMVGVKVTHRLKKKN